MSPRFLVLLALAAPVIARADELVIVEPSAPEERERVEWRAGPATLEAGALVELDAARGGERPGYSVRRARARFAARLEKMLHLGVRLEAELSPTADEGPGLLDAAIEFRIASRGIADLGRVQLGQMKVPLSAEVLDAPEDLPFVERADGALRLAPFRDVGLLYSVRLPGRGDPITLHLGIYNGEGAGHLGGGRGSMDVVRLDGVVGDPSRARLGGRWGLALALDPDTALPDGRGRAVFTGGDLLVRYRALQVGGELVWRAAERGPDAGAVWAWAAWDLIPSVLETRARLQTLDDGDDLHRTLTLGASFYYLGRRFRLAYEAAVPLAPNAGRETVHTASFIAVL